LDTTGFSRVEVELLPNLTIRTFFLDTNRLQLSDLQGLKLNLHAAEAGGIRLFMALFRSKLKLPAAEAGGISLLPTFNWRTVTFGTPRKR
jgi:hypothetical protein